MTEYSLKSAFAMRSWMLNLENVGKVLHFMRSILVLTKVGILSDEQKEKLFGPNRDSMPVIYLFHVYCNEF